MHPPALSMILVGCGSSSHDLPDSNASTCKEQASIVYINRTGGTYHSGVDNSGVNSSPIVQTTATIGAYDDPGWPTARACITERLSPFEIIVTETDPGTAEHVEIVLSPGEATEIGLPNRAVAIDTRFSPCRGEKNGIHFIWPNEVANDPDVVCGLVVQSVGYAADLDTTTACGDAMSFDSTCRGGFTDADLPCGPLSTDACLCGGTTQNSFQRMADVFGHCP